MMDEKEVAKNLTELYQRLLNQPLLRKGGEWKDDWPGWERGITWHPDKAGVYILWESEDGVQSNSPPVYVGEGLIGRRIWESFQTRSDWQYAQILTDNLISGDSRGCRFLRKALERFCIVALDPHGNID